MEPHKPRAKILEQGWTIPPARSERGKTESRAKTLSHRRSAATRPVWTQCVNFPVVDPRLSEHFQLDVVQVGGGYPGAGTPAWAPGGKAGVAARSRPIATTGMSGGAMAVRSGDYGPVLVLAGEHQGEVGYYDDDDDGPDAIVYLGEPFMSDYVRLPRDTLEKIDARSLELERWKRAYPWLVKYVGVP